MYSGRAPGGVRIQVIIETANVFRALDRIAAIEGGGVYQLMVGEALP